MDKYGRERRTAVRVPLRNDAKIIPPPPHTSHPAVCADIGVGGMTLLTRYVPKEGEIFEVLVEPNAQSLNGGTMHARVQVRRSQATEDGLYSLGVEILEVIR
ncbi:MAG: PilZ domain-containing protein [Betaproteobacteria bacterium]|nr:PilZ domain-containing protein [Betaproteobacteria bacterium]